MNGFERRDLGSGMTALVSSALERAGFLAAFFERTGGVSDAPFTSLNGSYQVGDETTAVSENRRRAASGFGLERFCVPGLVHGTSIMAVGPKRATDGFGEPAVQLADADGTTTRSPGIGLGAFSADCVIAVLGHPRERRIALVHAGWRGLASGVLQGGAALFSDRGGVLAAIGPAIGLCHYEVGEDVALAVAAGSSAGAVTELRGGRRYLDLVATSRAILRAEGIRRIEDAGLCTACETVRLFSYRRDGTTGRHLALAVRYPG
ncbi:MAG: polyphenol oxidase family protein [Actinomycetota bacterium]